MSAASDRDMLSKITACSVLGVILCESACHRESEARAATDPLAPLRCFEIADDEGIASSSAVELCSGATSAAPGRCLQAALDRGDLTTQQAVQLCQGAASLAPFACLDQLADTGELTTSQIVDYCGVRCPYALPAPEAGNASCLGAALDRADLTTQMATELCVLASSTGPVDCFVAGQDVTGLSDVQLVELCAETSTCRYFEAPPAAY
jgi:hypothetical protein